MSDMQTWGVLPEAVWDQVVVVSPHLDDAVLGAAGLIAAHPGTTVVTVFSGRPDAYPDPPTDWDALAGFGSGDDVLAARRAEDERALGELGATPHWLDFVEHQYLERDAWIGPDAVVDTLEATLRALDPSAVVAPFGLGNPDHGCTHDALMLVRDRFPEPAWLCYEDTGYKHIPGLLAWRVAQLFHAGVWPTPTVTPAGDPARKRRALAHYGSQLLALAADWHLPDKQDAPEQLWHLAAPPPGWEGLSTT